MLLHWRSSEPKLNTLRECALFCSSLAMKGFSVLPRHTSDWENVVDRHFLMEASLELQLRSLSIIFQKDPD